jgi:hypothetical protein
MVGALDKVVKNSAVWRCPESVGRFLGIRRGNGMGIRAYAANPLGNLLGVKRVSTQKENFKPSEHFPHAFRIGDDIVFYGCINIEVTLKPGDRANIDFHAAPLFL